MARSTGEHDPGSYSQTEGLPAAAFIVAVSSTTSRSRRAALSSRQTADHAHTTGRTIGGPGLPSPTSGKGGGAEARGAHRNILRLWWKWVAAPSDDDVRSRATGRGESHPESRLEVPMTEASWSPRLHRGESARYLEWLNTAESSSQLGRACRYRSTRPGTKVCRSPHAVVFSVYPSFAI